MPDIIKPEFGPETLHHDDHFALSTSEDGSYRIRCTSCTWSFSGRRSHPGAREARLASMAHAVEFHNCTYKADPKNA